MEPLVTQGDTKNTLTVARLLAPEEVRTLLSLFTEIAAEQGWQPGEYLNTAPEGAVHFALFDNGEPVGGLQVVLPDTQGRLPCQNVWPEVSLPAACCHGTIIALRPAYRGHIAHFWWLCQALWCFCADQGITTIVLEATPRMVALYKRLGLPLQIIGELREHWGEPCQLVSVDTVVVAGAIALRARRSCLFRQMVLNALQIERPSAIVEARCPAE